MLFEFRLSQRPIVEPLMCEAAIECNSAAEGRSWKDELGVWEIVSETFLVF